MLRFLLASSLSAAALERSSGHSPILCPPLTPSVQVGCAKLESLLDMTSRGDTGPEVSKDAQADCRLQHQSLSQVLIPTTRGSHYAMEPWQWEAWAA